MKKQIFALALIAVGFGTSLVSCTKDDLNPTDVKANVETTNVEFGLNAESANTTTARVVDKNAVPVYVDKVELMALYNPNSSYNVSEMFTFGAPGVGVLPNFSLSGVALGSNTFQATSWGKDTDKRLSLGDVSGSDILATMKAHTPWILCTNQADRKTVDIKKSGNPIINLTMATDNGRVLAKFVQETPDADKYTATVSVTVPTGDFDANTGMPGVIELPETTITPTLGFEWSNENARFTEKAVFTIRIYSKSNDILLNTITKEVAVKRATTSLATFTVKNTDVETDIQAGGINLIFPTIGEEIVN